MGANADGPAWENGAADDKSERASQRTTADPPPPGFIDCGNGDLRSVGPATEAGCRAAAEWLGRHYPEESRQPAHGFTGPIYAMSNYRVRQVLGLGAMPERQLRLLIALATWMGDDTRTVRVGFEKLIAESGKSHNTVRNARRELEADGKLATQGGRGKGNLTVWTALCLPEKGVSDVDPHADPKGTSEVGTFSEESKGTSEVGTFTPEEDPPKGTNQGSQKVPAEGSKRYQPQRADQQEPEMGFNLRANPLGSISLSSDPVPVHAREADDGERENDSDDFDEDEEEPDPDFKFLAGAVPGADWRDVEDAVTGLQYRKHKGEIRTTVRAYLRKIIENGDAQALIDDAAAERRRGEMDVTRYGDPFGGSVRPDTGQGHVVAGEVVQSADVRPTDAPETRTPAPVLEMPGSPGWLEVQCPTCLAGPSCYCRSTAGGHSAPHAERHRAAAASQVEAAAS